MVAEILPETLFSHGMNLCEHRYESENLFKALSKIFKGAELDPTPLGPELICRRIEPLFRKLGRRAEMGSLSMLSTTRFVSL
jgi:hypothetical protein